MDWPTYRVCVFTIACRFLGTPGHRPTIWLFNMGVCMSSRSAASVLGTIGLRAQVALLLPHDACTRRSPSESPSNAWGVTRATRTRTKTRRRTTTTSTTAADAATSALMVVVVVPLHVIVLVLVALITPRPKRSKGFRAGGPREYTRSVMERVGKIATRTRRRFRFQTIFPQLSASVEERKMETISPPPKNVL